MRLTEARSTLLILVALGFFAALGCLLLLPVPAQNKDFLQIMILALSNVFTAIAVSRPQQPDPAKPKE